MRRARARRRSRGGHERCERVPPNRGGDHEDGDDDHRQEDEHDHEPVHDLQGPRNLSAVQGDSEYEEQKPDPERLDGGKLRRSPRAAEDEREEAFARSLRPTSPDECEVEEEHREGRPEPESGGHAAERDDGSFTGGEGETPDFDVVEDLEDGGHEDDPPDADEAGRGPAHGTRTDQPLAAPDGNAERDHARTEDVQEQLFRVDPALDLEDLFRLRQVGQRQRRTALPDLHRFAGYNDLLPGLFFHHFDHRSSSNRTPMWMSDPRGGSRTGHVGNAEPRRTVGPSTSPAAERAC